MLSPSFSTERGAQRPSFTGSAQQHVHTLPGSGRGAHPCSMSTQLFCPTCANLLLGERLPRTARPQCAAPRQQQRWQRGGGGCSVRRHLDPALPRPLALQSNRARGRTCWPAPPAPTITTLKSRWVQSGRGDARRLPPAARAPPAHSPPRPDLFVRLAHCCCCAGPPPRSRQIKTRVALQKKERDEILGGEDEWAHLSKTDSGARELGRESFKVVADPAVRCAVRPGSQAGRQADSSCSAHLLLLLLDGQVLLARAHACPVRCF